MYIHRQCIPWKYRKSGKCTTFIKILTLFSVLKQLTMEMYTTIIIGIVYIIELTWTFYCCIARMWAGISSVIYGLAALSQATLSPYTPHIVVPGWTTASSKARGARHFQCSHVTQLTANDCGISEIPVVMTHSAPLTKEKDLNSSLV